MASLSRNANNHQHLSTNSNNIAKMSYHPYSAINNFYAQTGGRITAPGNVVHVELNPTNRVPFAPAPYPLVGFVPVNPEIRLQAYVPLYGVHFYIR